LRYISKVAKDGRRTDSKHTMAEIDLTFLQQQQQRILDELAEMRLEHRSTVQWMRDSGDVLSMSAASLQANMNELKAMIHRLENASRTQQDVNTLILERLGKLQQGAN
jgi:DNA polymerase/3'-5' exonuclease PolX